MSRIAHYKKRRVLIYLRAEGLRERVWRRLVRRHCPEGSILPWWALTLRAVLFPLQFFYWRMSLAHGYDWETDTWKIDGIRYSGDALRSLAASAGEVYRIENIDGVVTLSRIAGQIPRPWDQSRE